MCSVLQCCSHLEWSKEDQCLCPHCLLGIVANNPKEWSESRQERRKARFLQGSLGRIKEVCQVHQASGGDGGGLGRSGDGGDIRERRVRGTARVELCSEVMPSSPLGGTVLVIQPQEGSSLPELRQWMKVTHSTSS